MIVEQRTYRIRPGKIHEFLKKYEAEGLPLQEAALGNLIGYFTTEVGDVNAVVQLWGFDTFEDRLQRRAALSGNPKWREFAGGLVSLIESQSSQMLLPTQFSPIR